MTPLRDVSPTVGLIPTTPLFEAGPIIEVSVSVPNDNGTMFAETATAEPELEPSEIAQSDEFDQGICYFAYKDCWKGRRGYALDLLEVNTLLSILKI